MEQEQSYPRLSKSDDEIRQGHIVLDTPARRAIFLGALVLAGLVCLIVGIVALT